VNIFIDGWIDSFTFDKERKLEEKMVEVGASIINYCLKKSLATSLTINAHERIYLEGRSPDKIDMFLKELIAFVPMGETPLHDFLIIESRRLSYGSTLIIIVTDLNKNLFNTVINLKGKGLNILLMIIKNHFEREDILMINYINNMGVDVYKFDIDSDIREVLEVYSSEFKSSEK